MYLQQMFNVNSYKEVITLKDKKYINMAQNTDSTAVDKWLITEKKSLNYDLLTIECYEI